MKKATIITLALIFVLCFPAYAYAYLDPGTGSYFLQIIIATLLGSICAQLKPKEILICYASS